MRFPPSATASLLISLLSPSAAFSSTRRSLALARHASIQRQCAANSSIAWAKKRELYYLPLSLRGGTSSSSSTTSGLMMSTATASEEEAVTSKMKFRKDYKPLPYKVSNVELNFDIRDGKTVVESSLTVIPGEGDGDLILDGEASALNLLSIQLNGQDFTDYKLKGDELIIPASALGDGTSKITTKVEIEPEKNTQLSGLYKSGPMYCTQCEATGFRRITFYPDRPDNMAVFDRVRIEADKASYPILLGNGNKIEEGEAESGRHYAVWQDPFPKPSYLFCIVAGNLGSISSTYTTRPSGRKVHLEIFSEPENSSKLTHALESLKKSMKWDEDEFGLEYDLDTYNIVAVNDFNMGAMENKGLNVFNSELTLADPKSSSDSDYERIEGVIGHEYFHNWTGNRVTCRDWFQLTLKEGLTVYRDQEFSGDMMNSHAVKRIEDVKLLRARQFSEDSGPTSHPIRPESYISMDNFYSRTVYEKGAEVIRMYRTILGKEGFRKGMDLYFERHDGMAVTCDDFLSAMADANGVDLTQFSLWYSTNGTPTVRYESRYDADKKTFYLSLSQESNSEQPLHIPISVGLLDKNSGEEVLPTTVLDLKESSQTFEFPGMNEDVLPSILRGFSAPVKLVGPSKDDEQYLAFLASHDTDGFNRWEAVQKLYTSAIFKSLRSEDTARTMDYIYEAFERSLKLDSDDYSIQAYAMELPTRSTLEEMMDVIDTIGLVHAKKAVMKSIARKFYGQIRDKYTELTSVIEEKEFSVDAESIGQRRLRNVMLDYLCAVDETAEEREIASNLAFDQFKASYGMNDKQNALLNLVKMSEGEDEVIARRENAIQQFYDDAEGDPLVINKWFRLQAQEVALDRVKALSEHTDFTLKNPNRCRSLIGTFATSNPHFHAEDGSGYQFIGEMIAKVDLLNPQVSSRLAKDGLINWSRYPEKQGSLMKAELEKLALMKPISPDLFEIVKNGLK